MKRNNFLSRLGAMLAMLVAPTNYTSIARAQSNAAAGTGSSVSQDEPIVLSPFEVQTEQDTGYLATSAQSGTRLRTDLKDIAASISVVTKDFMNDIAATDLEGLLIYTLGTEVGGHLGNFSDAGLVQNPNGLEVDYDAAFGSALPSTRVRGLTRADVARDFFISSVPLDGYNVQRVEISRGANAMLFGLGSPAGIVNSSLEQANLNRRTSEVSLWTDQYGTFRSTLDHNQVLIPGKLAFRFDGLFEKEKYKVEEAWSKDRRGFGAVTYRPFRNTTFRANFELGNIDSNRPEIRPPPTPIPTGGIWVGRCTIPAAATSTLAGCLARYLQAGRRRFSRMARSIMTLSPLALARFRLPRHKWSLFIAILPARPWESASRAGPISSEYGAAILPIFTPTPPAHN